MFLPEPLVLQGLRIWARSDLAIYPHEGRQGGVRLPLLLEKLMAFSHNCNMLNFSYANFLSVSVIFEQ